MTASACLGRPQPLRAWHSPVGSANARGYPRAGSTVVHCPTSNNFLGSGLMSHGRICARPGGRFMSASPPMLAAARPIRCWRPWARPTRSRCSRATSPVRWSCSAWPRAAMPNACDLPETGAIDVGWHADLVVLDPCATPVLASRHELSSSLEDVLFCADDPGRRPGGSRHLHRGAQAARTGHAMTAPILPSAP